MRKYPIDPKAYLGRCFKWYLDPLSPHQLKKLPELNPLAAFVISCSAGLSAMEGLQPLGLVPETGLHGLGLAWSQIS